MKVILGMIYFKDQVFLKQIINFIKGNLEMENFMEQVCWLFWKIKENFYNIKGNLQMGNLMVKVFWVFRMDKGIKVNFYKEKSTEEENIFTKMGIFIKDIFKMTKNLIKIVWLHFLIKKLADITQKK